MKLQRVILTTPIRLPGMPQSDTEITDAECPELRYDEKTQSVLFGEGIGRPWAQVVEWEKANDGLLCPECDREFSNPQGLGAHRKAAHGVKGAA